MPDIPDIAEKMGFEVREYLEVLDVFLEHAPVTLKNIRSSIEQNDMVRLREFCHLMKGGASSIGLVAVAEIAQCIEDKAQGSEITELTKMIKELYSLIEELVQQRHLFSPDSV